jgi:hypothetical protein
MIRVAHGLSLYFSIVHLSSFAKQVLPGDRTPTETHRWIRSLELNDKVSASRLYFSGGSLTGGYDPSHRCCACILK